VLLKVVNSAAFCITHVLFIFVDCRNGTSFAHPDFAFPQSKAMDDKEATRNAIAQFSQKLRMKMVIVTGSAFV